MSLPLATLYFLWPLLSEWPLAVFALGKLLKLLKKKIQLFLFYSWRFGWSGFWVGTRWFLCNHRCTRKQGLIIAILGSSLWGFIKINLKFIYNTIYGSRLVIRPNFLYVISILLYEICLSTLSPKGTWLKYHLTIIFYYILRNPFYLT